MRDLRYNLIVDADVSAAKKKMQELQLELTKVGSQSYVGKGFSDDMVKGFQQAKTEVAELQAHLKQAFNADTGKLDFMKLNSEILKSGKTLEQFGSSLKALGPSGQRAFLNLADAISQSEVRTISYSKKLKQLGETFKNTIRWQISSSVIHGVMGAFQTAYKYAQDLNKSLNSIRIVTQKSTEEMAEFAEYANKSAQALSTTTTAYTNASLIFFQQGLPMEQVKERTDVVLKLANVTRDSVETVSSQLTSIWNNFDDGSESLELYADKITALGAATASSSAEISQGLEKFSAIAKTVGLSYDYATSALATVVAQTRQSAEIVGTAFKTIFGRLESLKLGETLEDETTLKQYSQALYQVGVNIKDQNGELKDMDVILDELGSKWKDLSKDQQIALAQTVGGVRQYNQLIALMDNYETFQKNVGIARGAEGTLQKQQNVYAESWEAASKRVQAAWESVYSDLMDDKFFIKMTNELAEFIKFLDGVIDRWGGIYGVLSQIAPLVMQLYNKEIVNVMQNAAMSAVLMTSGGRQRYEAEREQALANALEEARPAFGDNPAILAKYEDRIKYQEALTRYGEQLTSFDKDLLQALQEQNEARVAAIGYTQKEIDLLKERNAEAQKIMGTADYGSGIGSAGKAKAKEFIETAAVTQGIREFFKENSNISQEDRMKYLSDYMTENESDLRRVYGEGGLGKGHFGNLRSNLDKYFGTENPQEKIDIYAELSGIVEGYLLQLEQGAKNKSSGIEQNVDKIIDTSFAIRRATVAKMENADQNVPAFNNVPTELLVDQLNTYKYAKEDWAKSSNLVNRFSMGAKGLIDQNGLLKSGASIQDVAMAYVVQQRSIREGFMKEQKDYPDNPFGQQGLANMKEQQQQYFANKKAYQEFLANNQEYADIIKKATEDAKNYLKEKERLEKDENSAKEKLIKTITEQSEEKGEIKGQQFIKDRQLQQQEDEAKKDSNKYLELAKKHAEDNIVHAGTAQRITALSTAMMSLNAITSTTVNTFKTLFDESATPAQKLAAIVQGLLTVLGQTAVLMRGNTLQILKHTFFTTEDTAAQLANAAAGKVEAAAADQVAKAKEGQAASTAINTAETNADTASEVANGAKKAGGTLKLGRLGTLAAGIGTSGRGLFGTSFGAGSGVMTGAGALGGIAIAIVGAIIATTVAINNLEGEIDRANKKLEEENEEIKKWREKNYAALEASKNWEIYNRQLENNIITQDEYNEKLAETAKQMGLNNAEILAQAKAYGLLEKEVEKASKELEKENLDKARQQEINTRNLSVAGDRDLMQDYLSGQDSTYYAIPILTGGLSALGSAIYTGITGDYADFTSTTKRIGVGASLEQGEKELLQELKDLNINGVNVGERDLSWDISSMTAKELSRLYEFFGKVQANKETYGGEDNELIKNLNKMNEDFLSAAQSLKEAAEIQLRAAFAEEAERKGSPINKAMGSGALGYATLLEQAAPYYGEDVVKSYAQGKFKPEEIQTVEALSSFAKLNDFDLTDLVKGLSNSKVKPEDVLEAIDKAPDLMAAGLKTVEGDFSKLTEFMQGCIDRIDLSNLDSMSVALETVGSIKIGDIIKAKDYDNLKNLYEGIDNFVEVLNDGRAIALASGEEISKQIVQDSIDLVRKVRADSNQKKSVADLLKTSEGKLINGSLEDTQTLSNQKEKWAGEAASRQAAFEALEEYQGKLDFKTIQNFLEQREIDSSALTKADLEKYLELRETDGEKLKAWRSQQAKLAGEKSEKFLAEKKELDDLIANYSELENKYQEILDIEKNPYALEDKIISVYTTIEELQDYVNQGLVKGSTYQKELKRISIQTAKDLGIETEALKTQAEYLKANNIYVKDDEAAAYALALAYERQNIALDDLADNFDTYNKALNDNKKGSKEYTTSMAALQKDMQNLFNTDETISEDFILEHLKDIGKAAKDDQKAIKKLQADYALEASDIVDEKTVTDIQTALNDIKWDDLEIGVGVNTQDALTDLWNLTQEGIKDGSKLQEFWNSLGFEVEPDEVEQQVFRRIDTSTGQPVFDTIKVRVGWKAPKYSGNAHANKSKADKTKKGSSKKDKDEDKERYYVINNQLEDQEKLLDRIAKAEDRAFGAAKISLMERESKELEKQIDLQKKKLSEAEKYYKIDQAALNAFGARYGENGEVTNYDEMWTREYNRYKKTGDETRWEDFKKKLKQYEDTRDLLYDLQDDIQDKLYELYDKSLEIIEYKVQIKVEVKEDELKLLDYYLNRLQKVPFTTARQLALMNDQLDKNITKQQTYLKGVEDILANHGITLDQWLTMSDEDKANAGFTEEEINTLRDYYGNIIDLQQAIDELEEKILSGPLEAFKEWNAEFEKQETLIEHNTSLLESYKDIADLLYSNNSRISKQFTLSLMEGSLSTQIDGVAAARAELEANRKERAKLEEQYQKETDENRRAILKKSLDEMDQTIMASEKDLLNKTKATLEAAKKVFDEKIDQAKDKMMELTNSTDWDLTVFDHLKSLDDQWLDDYEKIYHLSKLTRDVNNSIDSADTVRHRERLKEITQEILEIEESGRKVSQYEVDALRKKYELRLAEIALEDAQAAKNQVRMSRDNEGNWSYVYTASTDAADKALQNYEDRLYEYQKLNSDFIKQTQEEFLKAQHDFAEKAAEIMKDATLTPEQRRTQLAELQKYYDQFIGGKGSQLDTAIGYNKELQEKDWRDYHDRTGYMISAQQDYATRLSDSYYGIINPAIQSGTDAYNNFKNALDNVFSPTTTKAMEDWANTQDTILRAAGTSMTTFVGDVSGLMVTAADSSSQTLDAVGTAAQKMSEDTDKCYEQIKQMNAQFSSDMRKTMMDAANSLGTLISQYSEMSKAADIAYQKASQASSITPPASGNNPGDPGKTKDTGGDDSWKTGEKMQHLAEALAYQARMNQYSSGQILANAKHRSIVGSINDGAILAGWTAYGESNQMLQFLQNKILSEKQLNNIYKILKVRKNKTTGFYDITSLDTGGYTGSWGNAGRLAVLHEKELVLNANDTKYMLDMVQIARDIIESASMKSTMTNIKNANANYNPGSLEQNVHIDASFPNVTDHLEIEQAFNNLVNMASQYANRK